MADVRRLSLLPLRGSFLFSLVQSESLARVVGKKHYEQQQQPNVIQLIAKIAPNGHALRKDPCGEKKVEHEKRARNSKGTHPESQHHREANQQFRYRHRIS